MMRKSLLYFAMMLILTITPMAFAVGTETQQGEDSGVTTVDPINRLIFNTICNTEYQTLDNDGYPVIVKFVTAEFVSGNQLGGLCFQRTVSAEDNSITTKTDIFPFYVIGGVVYIVAGGKYHPFVLGVDGILYRSYLNMQELVPEELKLE